MVFESIVKELLNRYLGEYVENLDANQLNVGIWSGMFFYCFFLKISMSVLLDMFIVGES